METPLVSIVILNFRTPLVAVRCVQALQEQTIAKQCEILVIDNGSDDESIGVLRVRLKNMPNVRIIEHAINTGFGSGYNYGIAYARGTYLLINNPAKIIEKTGLERMVQAMEQDPSIGILGPRLLHEDGTARDSFRAFPRPLDVLVKRTFLRSWFPGSIRRYLQANADQQKIQETDWVIGGCLLMRRSFFEELKGFDDRFFLFFEDIDLCRRTWKAGKRVVYFPAVIATDRKRRLSEGGLWSLLTSKVGRTHIASALKYFGKWGWRTDR